MQFARGRDGGFAQFAIKLFFDRNDYARETAHYVDKAIAPVLPELKFASDNASGSLQQEVTSFHRTWCDQTLPRAATSGHSLSNRIT